MNRDNHGSVALYVIIALILGVLTYIEYAIIEFDIAWLSPNMTMTLLVVITVIKFLLVVMFFMHLKGDDNVYSGFFTSGMIMALGTFIGLAFLFTVKSKSNYTFTNQTIEVEQVAAPGAPPPADQSQAVQPPAAADQDAFAVGEEGSVSQTVAAFDTAAAEAAYAASCASCHQATGAGLPGAFPPLAGNAANVHNAEGGREVLLHTVLFGMMGPIEVDGVTYNGAMPAWGQLGDEDIALILNHITTAWGNADLVEDFEPYSADEVADSRGLNLSPDDVHAERVALEISAAAPAEAPAEEETPAEEPAEEEPAEESVAEEEPGAAEEEAAAEEAPAATVAGSIDLAAGEEVYSSTCASCHQANGEGLPGAFPPLAGHVPDLVNADGGREVLIHTVLYGMFGPIEVDGTPYSGAMPAWGNLDDQQVADVLNYVANAWDNEADLVGFEPFTEEQVAAERGLDLSPQDVHAAREQLDFDAAPEAEEAEEAEEAAEPEDDGEEAEEAEAAAAAEPAEFDRAAAEAAYAASCASCHNSEGVGIPQVFPPLAGHVPDVYNVEGGRVYLQHVLLYGLTGPIEVDGITYSSAMPAWQSLDNQTLADIYNHIVTAWGNEAELTAAFSPMTAAEMEEQRHLNLSTSDVHAQRQELGLD